MKLLNTLVVGCCAVLCASQALGSLVIDLRFTDGSTTKDISTMSAGQTVTIQVWATVTGTDTLHTNDGLVLTYFGLLSANTDTTHLTGNLTSASAVLAPFSDPSGFQPGAFADRNTDTIGDWRGTTTNNVAGWAKAQVNLSAPQLGGGAVGVAAGANGWAFHIADAIFQIGSLSTTGVVGTQDVLTFNPAIPVPTLISLKASWQEDAVIKTGANGPTLGTSVTFELSSVPEPSSFALAATGFVGLSASWRRKRRR